MSVAPIDDGYTVDDLDDLDLPPGSRAEIIDGSVHVSPPPAVNHQVVEQQIREALARALPDSLRVLGGVGIGTPTRFLIPDIVVVEAPAVEAARAAAAVHLPPDAVRLAVEIVSPSSRTHDWVTKPNLYPAMGVATFWVVDPLSRQAGIGADGGVTVVTDTLSIVLDGVTVTVDLAEVLG